MAAITQTRAYGAFTGRRYGTFADKGLVRADFMYGHLRITPHVVGPVLVTVHTLGTFAVNPVLQGDIRTNRQ